MVALEKYNTVDTAFRDLAKSDGYEFGTEGDTLYCYKDGAWSVVTGRVRAKLEKHLYTACQETNFPFAEKKKQLWEHIKAGTDHDLDDKLDKAGILCCINCAVDPVTGEMFDHSPSHYTTRRVEVLYDPESVCPEWMKMLDRMFEDLPDETRQSYIGFLQRWFGLAVVGFKAFKGRGHRKALVLYGEPRTGKSTILNVLKDLFGGQDEVATADVHQLSSRFGLEVVVNARALLSDDAIDPSTKVNGKALKKLVTGERQTADRKGLMPISFEFNGPVLLTTNDKPKIKESTHALYDRLVVMATTRQFTAQDASEHFGGHKDGAEFIRETGELPGVLNWALQGFRMVVEEGGLPAVKESLDATRAWRVENDAPYAFVEECCEYAEGVANSNLVIGQAVKCFAEVEHSERHMSARQALDVVQREFKNMHGKIERKNKSWQGKQTRIVVGLKLNAEGLRWVEEAKSRGWLPPKVKVNEATL